MTSSGASHLLPAIAIAAAAFICRPVAAPSSPHSHFSLSPTSVILSVEIRGNAALSTREVLDVMMLHPGDTLRVARLDESRARAEDLYRSIGYLGVRVLESAHEYSPDSSGVGLAFDVLEGRRTVIGRLSFEGISGSFADRVARFETSVGDPLNSATLEQDLQGLLEAYERSGYPYARAAVGRLAVYPGVEEDSLEVVVSVEEGERALIGEIRVEGLSETSPDVVEREARRMVGEPYDPRVAESVRRRLNRLNIFSAVGEPELYERGPVSGVLFKVSEGTSSTFDGILGYQPGAQGQPGVLTGLVSVGMRNLFGTGRRLSVRWQRDERSSQEIAFRYLEPWLFGLPLNAGAGFFQRQQDSAYVRRVLDGSVEVVLSEAISIGGSIADEQVIPSSTVSTARVSRSSSMTAGVSFRYDTRSDVLSPETGILLLTEYAASRKNLSEPAIETLQEGISTVQRIRTDLESYTGFVSRQVIAAGFHGRQVKGPAVEESEMIRFGGATTLRGYRELQFLATLALWANIEYRFLTGRRSYVYGFFDPGYYSRTGIATPGLEGAEEFLFGYGAGIRTETPIGVVGVSFALGKGDSFSQGKVHVGLVNEF